MSLKITRISTHWDAAEACTVIQFLDELRDQLCEVYGDQIADMLREASESRPENIDQGKLAFDDDIPF